MGNPQENNEYEKIKIPSIIEFVPSEDSVLKKRLKRSKLFARVYLYCCKSFQDGIGKIVPKELSIQLKINRTTLWEILEEMKALGYLGKHISHKGYGGSARFFPRINLNIFIKKEFVDIASKTGRYRPKIT